MARALGFRPTCGLPVYNLRLELSVGDVKSQNKIYNTKDYPVSLMPIDSKIRSAECPTNCEVTRLKFAKLIALGPTSAFMGQEKYTKGLINLSPTKVKQSLCCTNNKPKYKICLK